MAKKKAAHPKRAPAQHKSLRPTWEGHLRLSLVTCPVALYSATERTAEIHFNMINPKTNNRIRMQTVDAGTGRPVDRGDLVRGFEVSKNKYILLDKEELDAVKLESTRIIDIEAFVDAATIDRIYWDEPYYLAPVGRTGIEAYAVIQAAMEKQDKVALGRIVMHTRERIRSSSEIFDKHLPKPERGMLDIAEKIIEQQQAKFDPTAFKDRYEDALRELIARKKKGKAVTAEAEPDEDDGKVIDLMDALRKSLKGGGGKKRAA